MLRRPQKITFAEMRASGVRGPMIYCSDITARIGLRSAAIDGPMTCACLIWSRGLPARLAAGLARMYGRKCATEKAAAKAASFFDLGDAQQERCSP